MTLREAKGIRHERSEWPALSLRDEAARSGRCAAAAGMPAAIPRRSVYSIDCSSELEQCFPPVEAGTGHAGDGRRRSPMASLDRSREHEPETAGPPPGAPGFLPVAPPG